MPLSETAIAALKPQLGKSPKKVHDRDGLFIVVAKTGTKAWVLRYRINGFERTVTLGRWPEVGLKKARERAQEERKRVAEGVDPVQHKRRQKANAVAKEAATFNVVAEDWMSRQAWTPAVRKQYERLVSLDIKPRLGRLP